jgi:hypothetical protein
MYNGYGINNNHGNSRNFIPTENKNILKNILRLAELSERINSNYDPIKLSNMNDNDIKALDGTLSRIVRACEDVDRLLF